MNAVIVTGFKMPKNCCFCSFERRKVCVANMHPITDQERRPYAQRVSWCPLKEVNLKEVKGED